MSFPVGVDEEPPPPDPGLAANAGTAVATTSMHTRPARTDTRTGVPLRFRCATTSLPPSLAKAILRALPICVKSTETSFHVAIPDVLLWGRKYALASDPEASPLRLKQPPRS